MRCTRRTLRRRSSHPHARTTEQRLKLGWEATAHPFTWRRCEVVIMLRRRVHAVTGRDALLLRMKPIYMLYLFKL